jgi:tRNA-2-methylthio-N6-dimethylallyladenosine synthase
VPEAEKDRRLQELQALLREQQARFNAGCVGRTLPVLFTGPGRHPGQVAGRSPFLQPVHLTGPASLIGTETPVNIVAAHTNSLSAALASATVPTASPSPSSQPASSTSASAHPSAAESTSHFAALTTPLATTPIKERACA